MCCSPWGHKELDTTECLNSTDTLVAVKTRHRNSTEKNNNPIWRKWYQRDLPRELGPIKPSEVTREKNYSEMEYANLHKNEIAYCSWVIFQYRKVCVCLGVCVCV